MGLGRKDQKIAAPLPRSESRESNAAPPFEYRHATTTTTGTTHMNCQLQGGCESREQRVEHGEGDEYRGRERCLCGKFFDIGDWGKLD